MIEKRILIIDDDPDYIHSVTLLLSGAPYRVDSAGSAEEGLSAARESPPDLILLDLMLPDQDGYSVCSRLKDDPATAAVPIVIATSLQKDSDRRYMGRIARSHRADAFLEKPVERGVLLKTLEDLLTDGGPPEREKSRKRSALLVDDDPDFLSGLEKILSGRGFEVYLAESGQEGLKLARAFRPDVILLDVMLPDQDGFTTCLELKKDPRTHAIPVIFLTAVGEEFTRPEYAETIAREHRADDFMSKPVRAADLLERIDRLTGREGR